MAMSAGSDDGEPMMDMNTTPLIDVMLVLLIMFIITLPIPTHAVKVDLPVNDPNAVKPPVDPIKNKIAIDAAGTITWNGAPVNDTTLRQYLDTSAAMTP
ncbi:biopolymer transporter ExbD, partial [uncultured Sphingomonas sp.]